VATRTQRPKKLKSCTSWHKIFAAIIQMNEWHKEKLEELGMLSDECKAYAEWVSKMDVQEYMRLSDGILAQIKEKKDGQSLGMPETLIMDMTLDDMKKLAAKPE